MLKKRILLASTMMLFLGFTPQHVQSASMVDSCVKTFGKEVLIGTASLVAIGAAIFYFTPTEEERREKEARRLEEKARREEEYKKECIRREKEYELKKLANLNHEIDSLGSDYLRYSKILKEVLELKGDSRLLLEKANTYYLSSTEPLVKAFRELNRISKDLCHRLDSLRKLIQPDSGALYFPEDWQKLSVRFEQEGISSKVKQIVKDLTTIIVQIKLMPEFEKQLAVVSNREQFDSIRKQFDSIETVLNKHTAVLNQQAQTLKKQQYVAEEALREAQLARWMKKSSS